MKGVKYRMLAAALAALFLVSCKSMMADAVATSLSGANKKGIPNKPSKKAEVSPADAVMGETDTVLVGGFFPTALVAYEMMYASNKGHAGLAAMTGSLNVMYANAFVQGPAATLGAERFDEQDAEYRRAKMHYLRGRDYCLAALEARHKGFTDSVMSGDEEAAKKAIDALDKNDVNAAYWACAGWLGAFSLDPLDADLLKALSSPPAILEKAASLDKDYSAGAIWDVLSNFYISAPPDFGGDAERAKVCHEEAMRASGGKAVGPYLTYAESFCVNAGDKAGFKAALEAALAIDKDADPSTRLMTVIYQERAKRLLQHIDDYFVEW